jgi:hypothetical protein
VTLLLLDEPTDNLDLASGALGRAESYREQSWPAHDRWFARSFDQFLVFGATGDVYESSDPVWTRLGQARWRKRLLVCVGRKGLVAPSGLTRVEVGGSAP